MIKSLKIDEKLEKYISDHSYDLHPVQQEIINHNDKLGDVKKMQISISQGYFFQLFIRTNNIKNILEIGTFTGYSALSMGLALPKDGNIICLDINKHTSDSARDFFNDLVSPANTKGNGSNLRKSTSGVTCGGIAPRT